MHPPDLGPVPMTKRKNVQALDVAVSPDGATIAAVLRLSNVHDRQELFVWEASKKKQRRLLGAAPNEVEGVAFSPDGRTFATTGALDWGSGRVRFWNTRTWSCRTRSLGMGPRHIAYAPDGRTVAVAESGYGGSTKIGIVEVGTGRLIRRFGLIDGISQIAFSPDSRTLAVGHNPEVSVWSVGGRLRWRQRAHASEVALTFSPDGTALASCDDTTAVVWDAASGTARYFSKGHANSLRTLAYSPDGAVLAIASWDAIKLRDAATGDERATLKTDSVQWIGFWPARDQVSAVSYDLRFSTWNVAELLKQPAPQASVAGVQSRAERMSSSEQEAFLEAIFAAPEDDTARLAYADWLDERGQPARAEFIRVQIELARLTESHTKRTKPQEKRITKLATRARELFDQHSGEWLAGLAAIRSVIDDTVFERGFLARVRMTGIAVTDDHLRHLAGVPEIVELTLDNSRVTDPGLARLKPLRNLRELTLSGTPVTPAALTHLTALPKLVEVYHYDWGYESLPPELEAFKLKRNRRLDGLQQPERRAEALRSLRYVGEVAFDGDRLVGVRFSQRPATDADLAYLREFPELEQLSFCETLAVTSDGLNHLRGLTALKQLHLVDMHITTLEPLRHLSGLEELRVWTAPAVESDTLRFLAELPRLKHLSLFNCQFDDAIMPHLAALPALEELNLTENEITDEGLEHLAGLKRLKKLEVDYESERKALVRRLVRRK
jgi:uncharacterized protein (TIGR02996 family)